MAKESAKNSEDKDLQLNDGQAAILEERLIEWKDAEYTKLIETFEEEKSSKIEELEADNLEYRQALKEEMSEKLMVGLEEMRGEIRAEVVAEMIDTNPELKILESVKNLIAPILGEDYIQNTYASEISQVVEERDYFQRELELEEGARTLAELVESYPESIQNLIINMIKEGNAEEITEQFYQIIESFEEAGLAEADDEDMDDEEDEEETDEDGKKKKKKKKKKDDDDDSEDEDDEEDEDDDMDEDDDIDFDSFISEDEEGFDEETSGISSKLSEIAELAN